MVHEDFQGRGHIVVIVEGLAHAHDHDIGEPPFFAGRGPLIEGVTGDHELGHHLAGGEVAHQGLGAGTAEGAFQGAAHLGGEAQRATV